MSAYGNYKVKYVEDSAERFENYDHSRVEEFSSKVLICVCTWERRNVVEMCMANLAAHKHNARLVIYDDGSTEYDKEFLRQFADEVHMLPRGEGKREGVHALRIMMAKEFTQRRDYDWLYMTDSDAIHDPNFMLRFEQMIRAEKNWGAYSLFLSYYHTSDLKTHTQKSHGAAGISILFPRTSVAKIKDYEQKNKQAWDGAFCRQLADHEVLCSQISYVEHMGKGGFNNFDSWERVRARCPTKFLADMRPDAMARLES